MSKRTYDLTLKDLTTAIRSYFIPVDESAEPEAKKISIGALLRTDDLKGQYIDTIDYEAVTPKSMLATVSEEGLLGLIRIASNTLAVAATNTANALVPSNLNSIFNARFSKTKSYLSSDFDEVASNYTTISITSWNEMVVGNFVTMDGYFIIETADVPNIEIVLNATKTPLTLKGMTISRFATPHYIPHGAAIITSSGKLKMTISNSDGGQFGAGTHEFAFSLTYFSA